MFVRMYIDIMFLCVHAQDTTLFALADNLIERWGDWSHFMGFIELHL